MLLSKSNIMVAGVAASEGTDPELACVHIAGDGSTVAANGRMMMAVEAVSEDSFFPIEESERASLPEEGVSLPLHIIDQVRKNLPRDKRPVMQQAAITKCSPSKVELTTISKTEERKVGGRPLPQRFPRWREVFAETRQRAGVTRVCFSRKDLTDMVDALDKACSDPSGKNVVFMHVGGERDPILLRAVNLTTGQHAVGMVNPIDTKGMWISENPWEEELYASGVEESDDLPAVPVRSKRRIQKRRVSKKKLGE